MRPAAPLVLVLAAACGSAPGPSASSAPGVATDASAARFEVSLPTPNGAPTASAPERRDVPVAPELTASEVAAMKEIRHQVRVAIDAPYGPEALHPTGAVRGSGRFDTGTAGLGSTGSLGGPSVGTGPGAPPVVATSTLVPTAAPVPDDVQSVLARSAPSLRRCYQRALKSDPAVHGKLDLVLTVGADGVVRHVAAVPPNPLPAELTACLQARFLAATFSPTRAPTSFVTHVVLTTP